MNILLRFYKSTMHRKRPWRYEIHIDGSPKVQSIRRYATKRDVAAAGRSVACKMGSVIEEWKRYAMEPLDVETEMDG